MPSTKRVAATRTLAQILPRGAESGKEFSRIVDLLLVRSARQKGETLTVLNDAAGDFAALDSFATAPRAAGKTGYQYKFFPSPLADAHRSQIRKALEAAIAAASKSKITRWVIITPEDLTESAKRRSGGDVTWFEQLRATLALQRYSRFGE